MAGPTPTGVTRTGSHPVPPHSCALGAASTQQTRALAPRCRRPALPAPRNPLIGASSGEAAQSVTARGRNRRGCCPPTSRTSPRGPRGVPTSPHSTPAPSPDPGGGSGLTPSGPMASGHPQRREGDGGRNANTPRTCPDTFPPGAFGARELLPSWGNSDEDRFWEELPNPIPAPHRAGRWAEHRHRAAGGVQGTPRRGPPEGRGPPSPGRPSRAWRGSAPTRTQDNSQAGDPTNSFQLPVGSKTHTQGPQGQASVIFPWQTSKRNISPFYPTI